jgi:hypothetical protein
MQKESHGNYVPFIETSVGSRFFLTILSLRMRRKMDKDGTEDSRVVLRFLQDCPYQISDIAILKKDDA